jgi:ParB family chromosome partitioning protein
VIEADPDQPRRSIDPGALEDLAASIKSQGLLQPLVVRHKPGERDAYVVVAGERRMRAARLAGLAEVPCMILAGDSLREARLAQLAENMQREDLTPMEEARAVVALAEVEGLMQEELATRLGKSPTYISRIFAVSRIPAAEYEELATLKPSMSVLYEYAQLPEDAAIRGMAVDLVRDGATVKDIEGLRTGRRRAAASAAPAAGRRGRPRKASAPVALFERAVRALSSLPASAVDAKQRVALLAQQAELARWLASGVAEDGAVSAALRDLEAAISAASGRSEGRRSGARGANRAPKERAGD